MEDKIIQMPDGRSISFPSSMSDEQIGEAIRQQSGGAARQYNESQRQNIMGASREKAQGKFEPYLNPFTTIARNTGVPPAVGGVLDKFNLVQPAAQTAQTFAGAANAPNAKTAASRAGLGLAQLGGTALQTMYPVGSGIAGNVAEGISKTGDVGKTVMDYLTSPFTKMLNPQTETGENATKSLDLVLPALAAKFFQEPVKTTGEVARSVIPEAAPRKLAGAAHKPPFVAAKGIETFDRQIGNVIREDLPPTRGGLDKAKGLLNQLDNTSKPLRDAATAQGVTVDFGGFKKFLEDQKSNFTKDADYNERVKAIDDMISRVNDMGQQYPNSQVPLNDAWKFKRSLQNMVGTKYDQYAGYGGEAVKTAAHGLLDDILSKVPELREIGLRQRDLIDATDMMGRRVASETKQGIISPRAIRMAVTGATAGYYGGEPAALGAAALEGAAESPYVQHKAAVALDRLRGLGKAKTSPYGEYTPQPFPSGGASGGAGGASVPPTAPSTPPEAPATPNAPQSIKDLFPNYEPSPKVGEFGSTPEAVESGKKASYEEAAQKMEFYNSEIKRIAQAQKEAMKLKDPMEKRNAINKLQMERSANQYNREFVEGYIAQRRAAPHQSSGGNYEALKKAFGTLINPSFAGSK